MKFTAILHKDDDMYVALCPELDIASQGTSIEEAKSNLKEAISLFFEYASKEEIMSKLKKFSYFSSTNLFSLIYIN